MALILEEVINSFVFLLFKTMLRAALCIFFVLNLDCLVHCEYMSQHLFADSVQKATNLSFILIYS